MELKGDYTFDAPQNLVWEALNDPNVLGSVMPGSEGFEEVSENHYKGQLKVKVGPVQGLFDAEIHLVDVNEPDSYTIEVDGKGNVGYVKATGGIELTPAGEDQTHMDYAGEAQISGRIASVGQRLMISTARSIVRQSLGSLNEYLKMQVASQATAGDEAQPAEANGAMAESAPATEKAAPPPPPQFEAPSEIEVGMNVAKDVFDDMVPEKYQPVVLVAALGFVVWLFRKIFS